MEEVAKMAFWTRNVRVAFKMDPCAIDKRVMSQSDRNRGVRAQSDLQ
jgi:hypothetical protein